MKAIFLQTRYTGKVDLDKIELGKLPKKLGLVTTTQFLGKINEIKNYLEGNGKEIFIDEGKQIDNTLHFATTPGKSIII